MHHVSAFVPVALIVRTPILVVRMAWQPCVRSVTGRVTPRVLPLDNANRSPFMHRLSRAHANRARGRPVFGGPLPAAAGVAGPRVGVESTGA